MAGVFHPGGGEGVKGGNPRCSHSSGAGDEEKAEGPKCRGPEVSLVELPDPEISRFLSLRLLAEARRSFSFLNGKVESWSVLKEMKRSENTSIFYRSVYHND